MYTPPILRYFPYALPLKREVEIGSETMILRRGILIRATDGEDHAGWGEAAPLDGYGPDTYSEVLDAIQNGQMTPSLRFGIDCAIQGVKARDQGLSFAQSLGVIKRSCLECAVLSDPGAPSAPVSSQLGNPVKVKIARASAEAEAGRVLSLLDSTPETPFRLDANGMWDELAARRFAELLKGYEERIEFVEEPWKGCFEKDCRSTYSLPMAIDESLRHAPWQHADVLVIKPSLMGSLHGSLALASRARATGKKIIWSSAFESGVGMTAISALASLSDGGAVGFGTYRFLTRDIGASIPEFEKSSICLAGIPDVPGEGLSVDTLHEWVPD